MARRRGGEAIRRKKEKVFQLNMIRNKGILTCEYCWNQCQIHSPDKGSFATLEHIIPISKGGTYAYENLKVACRQCNHEKGSLDTGEFIPSRSSGAATRNF